MPRESKGDSNSAHYVRHVPKFLQQYSHMLKTNKKNYLNEEVTHASSDPRIDELVDDGCQIVSEDSVVDAKLLMEASAQTTTDQKTETPADTQATNSENKSHHEDHVELDRVQYVKRDKAKRQNVDTSDQNSDIPKKKSRKQSKNLLSFEQDEDM